jgi:hypothetical protein
MAASRRTWVGRGTLSTPAPALQLLRAPLPLLPATPRRPSAARCTSPPAPPAPAANCGVLRTRVREPNMCTCVQRARTSANDGRPPAAAPTHRAASAARPRASPGRAAQPAAGSAAAAAWAGRRGRMRAYRLGGRWAGSTGGAPVRSSSRTTPKEKTSDAGVYSSAGETRGYECLVYADVWRVPI